MDIAKAFTFITEDEHWGEKVAIGVGVLAVSTLLSSVLVGILGFFMITGYALRLLQNVRDGAAQPLPEWNQWGDDLIRGLKLAVVSLVWSLPIFVVIVPLGIGIALSDSGGNSGEFVGGVIIFCGVCLTVIYGLIVALLTPGFTIAFAKDEEIRSGLELTEIWRWTQQNLSQTLLAVIVTAIGSFAIGVVAIIVGILLCGVGLLATIPLSIFVTMLFQYHLFGQLARTQPLLIGEATA
ncbi:MAG: DUF4013 domain-containing protein [Caldilineaceae bacterium]